MSPRWLDVDTLTSEQLVDLHRDMGRIVSRRSLTAPKERLQDRMRELLAEHAAARPALPRMPNETLRELLNEGLTQFDFVSASDIGVDELADWLALRGVRLAGERAVPSAAAIEATVIAAARELVIAETAGLTSARQWDALCAALKQYDAEDFGATEEAPHE